MNPELTLTWITEERTLYRVEKACGKAGSEDDTEKCCLDFFKWRWVTGSGVYTVVRADLSIIGAR